MKHNKEMRHREYTARKNAKRAAMKAAKRASRNRAKYAPRGSRRQTITPARRSSPPGLLTALAGLLTRRA